MSRLQIGVVAKLLGVTPKAIRHYHKLGLLSEPERTEGGYRLYTASDVRRAQRIRQLQALGLSLQQVKAVLGAPDHERSLREVLESLSHELAAQIATLEARRTCIDQLLADESLDTAPESLSLELARVYFPDQPANMTPAVLKQDRELLNIMENLNWNDGWQPQFQGALQEAFQYYAAHPDQYQAMVAWGERFVALAEAPKDSPELPQLVEDFFRSEPLQALVAAMEELGNATPQLEQPHGLLMMELLSSALTPAQRCIIDLIERRQKALRGQGSGIGCQGPGNGG
jgi:DNA-binding transcriptional MerR regulator